MESYRQQAIRLMNESGRRGEPFIFIVDFLQQHPVVLPLQEVNPGNILYATPLASNLLHDDAGVKIELTAHPVSIDDYAVRFNAIQRNIKRGNSFVTNLTFSTPVECNAGLKTIFYSASAKYKLYLRDQFVCFSPETFVTISDGTIATCPMKGTIDASLPDAGRLILENGKEQAEHNCVVDLLRNDLSLVADNVEVTRYRYIDRIETDCGALLQVSSEIRGILAPDYPGHLGDIIFSMLPAGSITGAPKIRTTEIIRQTETHNRNYYTGVFGIFDGIRLDSAVMIRFIEQTPGGLVYKSGGGITAKSLMKDEYEELNKKIYVPVYRKYQD
jgi:para-aminobenzoate synthetase component 1